MQNTKLRTRELKINETGTFINKNHLTYVNISTKSNHIENHYISPFTNNTFFMDNTFVMLAIWRENNIGFNCDNTKEIYINNSSYVCKMSDITFIQGDVYDVKLTKSGQTCYIH